jgi:large subunit ribosomal protein L21
MSDFAIIKTGGKQYKVKVNDKIKVEKLEAKDTLEFDDILFGKKVTAKIIANGKAEKVKILKQHPKKRYKRVNGHRQLYSEIEIINIK